MIDIAGWRRVALAAVVAVLGCDGIVEPPVPPAPTVTALSPSAGNRSSTVRVALTGADFHVASNTIQVSGSGVTVNDFRWHSPTSVDAEFIISATAETGNRDVTITTPGGTSAAIPFTVRLATPTLSVLTPNSGVRGTTVVMTLNGTHFVSGGTTVAVSGGGITVSNVRGEGTTLLADLRIDADAAIGNRTVTVTTASGTSNGLTFTVNPQSPTITGISPSVGALGATVTVTLTGTNFVTGGTTVAVSGSDVTVSNVSVSSATTLTASFTIGAAAAIGARNVTVTTAGGVSAAQTFTVNPLAPTLTAVSPSAGVRGNTVAVTLTGTNFITGATTVAVSGSDVTVSNVNVASGTSLTADFAIASGAALGSRDVTITTAGGTSGAQSFTVNPVAPTLIAVSPVAGVQGNTVAVTLTGTNFITGGTTVAVSGSGVTVSNVSVASGTSLTADFAIAGGAALGARNVTVTTAGGTTAAQTFTVNPPPPTLGSVSPVTGVQGTTVSATLTGTNFVAGGTTVAVSGSNVTVSNVSVASGTTLTADLVIASGAALGARNVTVTTAGGTSAAQTFTINPPVPTLTGISPTSGVQGTTVSVTLTGTNFVTGATTVSVSGSGVTASSVSVSSGTSLTVNFVIGATAAAGARTVTVTTAGGTSGGQTFTVNAASDPQEIPVQPSRLPAGKNR